MINFFIRNAGKNDLELISQLHILSFDNFFLSKLGRNFLKFMYNLFFIDKNGVLLVAVDDSGKLLGFAAGCLDKKKFDADVRTLNNMISGLFLSIIPFIKNPLFFLKRVFRALFSKSKYSRPNNSAYLSSIAVNPKYNGNGIGRKLLLEFEKVALSHGYNSIDLTTDIKDNNKTLQFYFSNGYIVHDTLFVNTDREMYRLIKFL